MWHCPFKGTDEEEVQRSEVDKTLTELDSMKEQIMGITAQIETQNTLAGKLDWGIFTSEFRYIAEAWSGSLPEHT